MPRKPITYQAEIDALPTKKIFINVKNMENGNYEIVIINDKKTLLKTAFKKK